MKISVEALRVPELTRFLQAGSRFVSERPRITVAAVMLLSSLAVYLPFLGSMEKVCRYWDGPPYMYIAKTLYRVPDDHPLSVPPYEYPRAYYANHLPGYPLLIRAMTLVTLGDYRVAMLLATLLASVAAAVLFYELLVAFGLVRSPLWTAILFCFFPPRFVLYHSVGASEPLFLCAVFASLLSYRAGRTGRVIAWVALASVTRIVGTLLVPIYGLLYLLKREWRRMMLMPLGLLGLAAVFQYYRAVFGDYWAYFHWTVGQIGLVSPRPLAILARYAMGNKIHSVELYGWMYVLFAIGTFVLWRKREIFVYAAVFFAFCTFISGHDLPRYLLVLAPFSILVGFDAVLGRKAARWALPLIIVVDYTYAWFFLPKRMVPRGVWEHVLRALGG